MEPVLYTTRESPGCTTSRISCHARSGMPVPFRPPTCESVWDPADPPAIASAQVIGTVAYLDSVGYFSGGNGAVLGGMTPFSVYIQIALASALGALDGSSSAADTQCLATLEISLSGDPATNAFGPVLASDMATFPYANDSMPWSSFHAYATASSEFFERRVCPCYNRMPRALFEHMNCQPGNAGHDASSTVSQQFLHCQGIDTAAPYAGYAPLAAEMPPSRDVSAVTNWQGCQASDFLSFYFTDYQDHEVDVRSDVCDSNCELRHVGRLDRLAAYTAGITGNNMTPSQHPYAPINGGWLDAVAGTCTPRPVPFRPPTCESVWDPADPPAIASAQVIGTVAYLDSVGYFSGGNGAVLGGMTPFSVYIQIALASALGALDGSSSAADTQCLATLEISLSGDPATNAFGPVLASDMATFPYANDSMPWSSFHAYATASSEFFERRVCPCYNRMPRALFEHMNCQPGNAGHDASSTVSQQFLHCQGIDTAAPYAGYAPLAAEMPPSRDVSAVTNWQGCQASDFLSFYFTDYQDHEVDVRSDVCDSNCELRHVGRLDRLAAYTAGITGNNMTPSQHPYAPINGGWLDAVAGTCTAA